MNVISELSNSMRRTVIGRRPGRTASIPLDRDGVAVFKQDKTPVAEHVKMNYELHGSASAPKKLLFVMGMATSCVGWSAQCEFFNEYPDEYQYCVMDHLGIGWSDRPKHRAYWTLDTLTRDVVAFLEEINWDNEGVNIVGISMGGMIAQKIVLLRPQWFQSCSILASTPGTPQGIYGSRMLTWEYFIASISLMLGLKKVYARKVLKLMFSKEFYESNEEVLMKWLEWRMNEVPLAASSIRRGHFNAVKTHSMLPKHWALWKEKVDMPCLLLAASGDRILPPKNTEIIYEELGGRTNESVQLHVISPSGHGVNIEQADRVNSLLKDFIDNKRSSSEQGAQDKEQSNSD